jgi:RND family efflux transporter MFP subunit
VAGTPVRKPLAHYTTQPGRIEAFETTPLFSKIPGYVEFVAVDIGDEVSQGDVLVKLSAPELLDDVEQHEALVAQVESEIKQAEAAVLAAKADVRSLQAQRAQVLAGVDAAEAMHVRWTSEHARVTDLAAGGSLSRKLVEEAESQLKAADATWKQSEAAVLSAEAAVEQGAANVAKAEADLEAVKSRLRVAEAHLSRAKTMANYAEIKAPFNGVVTRREVDTGHFVQPASGASAKPLIVVARNDIVRIFVDIPETEASHVQGGAEGDTALVLVQALNDREYVARVTRTAWSLEASNRSLRAEIDVPNDDRMLRPGMYATAKILLDQRDSALTVPATAVLRQQNEFYCCRIEDGVIRRQRVTMGIRTGEDIEITEGLQDSDVVVLARTESLADGQAVEVATTE